MITSKKIPLIVLFTGLLILSIVYFSSRQIKIHWRSEEAYLMRFQWLDSVNFYLKTGKILMYPPHQRLEDIALAEDQGYPFILSLVGKLLGIREMNFGTFIRFNYLLVVILGTFTSLLIFLSFNSLFLALSFYFFYLKAGLYNGGIDHQWMLGVYIPFYLSFLILSLSKRKSFKPIYFSIYFLTAGIANTVREGDGIIGILLFFSLLTIILLQNGVKKHLHNLGKKAFYSLFFIFIYITPWLILNSVRTYRDKVYFNGTSSDQITHHGLWHNAFMGLGFVPNKYGIRWDDANNLQFVRKVNPKANYTTNEYYDILRRLYFKYSLESPKLWFINFFAKLKEIHKLQGQFYVYNNLILMKVKDYLLYILLLLMFLLSGKDKIKKTIFWLNLMAVLISSIPDLIAIPIMTYLHGLRASYFMTFFYTLVLFSLRLKHYFK